MAMSKIAITIDQNTLNRLDLLVKSHLFPNRSRAITETVAEKIERIRKRRLALECAKLNPDLEQELSEKGLEMEIDEWPEYRLFKFTILDLDISIDRGRTWHSRMIIIPIV